MGYLAWNNWAINLFRSARPKLCGSLYGPLITTPRVKLRDGRHLAYEEYGVPKDIAKHKFIFVHGFGGSRNSAFIATEVSPVLLKILLVVFMGYLAWSDWAINLFRPPQPKLCSSLDGPPITAPRVKLRDGRHLAYKEYGVPKDRAKHNFIFVHGFGGSRNSVFIATDVSPVVIEKFGLYIVGFDRPGYGESDPDPKRTPKSAALDIEDLADQLGLGSKFYVVGNSMGGELVWACLKYIPHRLAGATMVAPVINYWWAGLPANLSTEAYYMQLPQDQWSLRVAHYAPWLTYWWQTQRLFPPSSVVAYVRDMAKVKEAENGGQGSVIQQGEHDSLHKDMMVGFGRWEFSPIEMECPFPDNEASVHLWQGDMDLLVPTTLQRYIARRLPWIHYHELPGEGHSFARVKDICEAIFKTQLSVVD